MQLKITIEPPFVKTYTKTCGTSGDSYQSAHPRSVIRVSADRMRLLQPSDYLKRLVILGGCRGWSESLLVTRPFVGFVVRWLDYLFGSRAAQRAQDVYTTSAQRRSLSLRCIKVMCLLGGYSTWSVWHHNKTQISTHLKWNNAQWQYETAEQIYWFEEKHKLHHNGTIKG